MDKIQNDMKKIKLSRDKNKDENDDDIDDE